MTSIHELRIRSNKYIANLNSNIEQAIIPFEHFLIKFQVDQWRSNQIGHDGNNLPEYSSYSKSLKGLTYFNLYDTGSFQNKLTFTMNANLYLFSSTDKKLEKIKSRVGSELFGIAPMYRPEAKALTTKAIGINYKKDMGL